MFSAAAAVLTKGKNHCTIYKNPYLKQDSSVRHKDKGYGHYVTWKDDITNRWQNVQHHWT